MLLAEAIEELLQQIAGWRWGICPLESVSPSIIAGVSYCNVMGVTTTSRLSALPSLRTLGLPSTCWKSVLAETAGKNRHPIV
jgi:hypothetical protein